MEIRELATSARSRITSLMSAGSRPAFRSWTRQRPFIGGILTMLAGVEMFFSGQLDVGHIHLQVGIEGLQSTVLPVGMILVGLLAMLMPVHRIFYGVIGLVLSVYSLIGLNLGGFFVGMLLGAVGGILIVSWMPKKAATDASEDVAARSEDTAAEPRPLVGRRP